MDKESEMMCLATLGERHSELEELIDQAAIDLMKRTASFNVALNAKRAAEDKLAMLIEKRDAIIKAKGAVK